MKFIVRVMILAGLLGCNIEEFHRSLDSTEFMRQIASSGIFEISISNLALQKATNAEVSAFAAIMVEDHTNIKKALEVLASQKETPLPDTMDVEKQSNYLSLSQEPGIVFDKKYISQMLALHKTDLAKFDSAARFADDKEVREWAATRLPVLKMHLARNEELSEMVADQ